MGLTDLEHMTDQQLLNYYRQLYPTGPMPCKCGNWRGKYIQLILKKIKANETN
jgi:hypothetical protein